MDWLKIQQMTALAAGGLFLVTLLAGIFTVDRVSKQVGQILGALASALIGIVGFCLTASVVANFARPIQFGVQLVVLAVLFFVFRLLWNALVYRKEGFSPEPVANLDGAGIQVENTPASEFIEQSFPAQPRANDNRPPEVAQRCQEIVTDLNASHPEIAKLGQEFHSLINQGLDERSGDSSPLESILNDLRSRPELRVLLDTLQQDLASLKTGDHPPLDKIADRAREISEVAFAVGEVWAAEAALDELLAINPADLTTLNRKGHARAMRGDLAGAAVAYRQLAQFAKERNDETYLAVAYGNLGGIHESEGDLDNAEKMHHLSLDLEEKNNNPEGAAQDYGNLGKIFQARGEVASAEEYFRKALELARKVESLEGEAAQYANLGSLYIATDDLEQAELMLRHALLIEERLTNREGMADNYANLGLIHIARGNLDQAAETFHRALYLEDKLDRADRRGYAYANLGQIFMDRSDFGSARRYWTQALDCFASIPLPDRVREVQGWLMNLPV